MLRIRLRLLSPATVGVAAFLLCGHASSSAQQTVSGHVIEQGSEAPIEGALVSLYDAGFEQLASVLSGPDGEFQLTAPGPGRYTVQAAGEGLMSASAQVEVGADEPAAEVVLVFPSRLVLLAGGCEEAERFESTGIVVGVVRDAMSGVPLPGAQVALRWSTEEGARQAVATADAGGRYRFCAAPAGVELAIQAWLLNRAGTEARIEMPRPALVPRDLEVMAASTPEISIERVRRPGPADGPGSLAGTLTDASSGAPVSGAVLTLRGQIVQQRLSDGGGSFRFDNLTPGMYTLEVQRLGYGVQRQEVEVPGSSDVRVALGLAASAVELEGVTVTARTPAEERLRASPGSRYLVSEPELDAMNMRGSRMADLLRMRMPGVTVKEGVFWTMDHDSQPILCIESSRGISSLPPPRYPGPFCDMVAVYIDGVFIGGAGTMLRGMQLADFAEVEFLSPVEAGVMYGLRGGSGVLLLTTKGRTPGTPRE